MANMYALPCPLADAQLEELHGGLRVKRLGLRRVRDYTRFVFDIYSKRFAGEASWSGSDQDYSFMVAKEERYAEQGVFLVVESAGGVILAGLRALRHKPGVVFLSESVFGVRPEAVASRFGASTSELWHGSQLAMDAVALRGLKLNVSSRTIIKRLFVHVLNAILTYQGRLILGETDQYSERWYESYGLTWQPLTGYKQNIGWDRASVLDLDAVRRSSRFIQVFEHDLSVGK